MKKYLILITFLLIFPLMGLVHAQVIDIDQLQIDENLYGEEEEIELMQAQNIVIMPIDPPLNDWRVGGVEWYRGIFYYLLGRQGLPDVSFHYAVTNEGAIIKGARNGLSQRISVADTPENSIYIAYLGERGEDEMSRFVLDTLQNQVLDIANRQKIDSENVYLSGVEFIEDEVEGKFRLEALNLNNRYDSSLESIKAYVEDNYDPQDSNYSVEIDEVKLPSEPVKPGSDVIMEISVVNTSEDPIFKGSDAEFIAVSQESIDSEENVDGSIFFINEIWLSSNSFALMDEGEIIRADEEATYSVRLNTPLFFGEQSETYVLADLNGEVYEGTEFDITFTIEQTDQTIVQVLDTETGNLNVRSEPNGEIVSSVLPGQRFIKLQDGAAGWVEIQLSEESTGWVSGRYLQIVN